MNSITTPTTSPSSDGVASATIASLSPKDLTEEYDVGYTAEDMSPSPRQTIRSTISTFPKDAFASSSNVIDRGDNSEPNPFHRNNLLESVMGLRVAECNETKISFYRMMVGSMLAYVVLGIWVWTVVMFMIFIRQKQCNLHYLDLGSCVAKQGSQCSGFESALSTMSCLEEFTGSLACAHSITFGLISAVVIHETGSTDETAKDRLSSMIKPLKKRRDVNANFIQRTFCSLITSLPAVYVVAWTVFGLVCFIYSLVTPDGSSGPLFYTGQTWIGLVVKATYSFFGVEPDDSTIAPSQTRIQQQSQSQV